MKYEEVEDFGGLESSVTRVEDARTGAEEQPVPQSRPWRRPCSGGCDGWRRPCSGSGAGWRRPCSGGCSFACGGVVLGALGLGFYFCDTESRLLRRFRRLGLRKKPLLMLILILWPLRMQCLLVEIRLVLKLSLGHQMGLILGARYHGLKSLRMKI